MRMQHNLIAYSDSMMSPSVRQILIQPKVMSVGSGIEAEVRAYARALLVDGVDTLTEVGKDFGEVYRYAQHVDYLSALRERN